MDGCWRSSASLVLVCVAMAACGPSPAPVTPPKPSATTIAVPAGPTCAPAESKAFSAEYLRARDAGVGALVSGQSHVAIRALRTLLRQHPEDVGVFALLAAARSQSSVEWGKTSSSIGNAAVKTIDEELSGRTVHAPVSFDAPERTFELGPAIAVPLTIDEMTWFARKDFERPGGLDDDESAFGAVVAGESLQAAFHYDDHQAYVFGDHIVGVRARDGAPVSLVSIPAVGGFHVQGARVAGDALIVQLVDNSSEDSDQWDGFLAAIDLGTARFRWVGESHTAMADSFVIAGHYAITGYGTGERGSIQIIDLVDGKVKSRVPLPEDPGYIVAKGDKIIVVSFKNEFEITASPALPSPARARLDEHGEPDASLAYERCTMGRALAALDARDGRGAIMELGASKEQRAASIVALRAAADFLDRAKGEPDSFVDLSSKSPYHIDTKTRAVPRSDAKLGPPPDLSKKTTIAAHRPPPKAKPRRSEPSPEIGSDLVPPPPFDPRPGAGVEAPDTYGDAGLFQAVGGVSGSVLVYGNEYVAVLDAFKTRAVFDVARLVYPEGGPDLDTHTVIGDVATNGRELFVSIGLSDVPYTMTGDAGYVVAFDIETGALLWKSSPLTSTTSLVLAGDYLVTAGGAEGGAGTIFVFRPDNGEVVSRVALAASPTQIGTGAGNLIVLTPNEYFTFPLGAAAPKVSPPKITLTPQPAKIDF